MTDTVEINEVTITKGEGPNYLIVQYDEKSMDELVNAVNKLIGFGYRPQGGICTRVGTSYGAYIMQAMILRGI